MQGNTGTLSLNSLGESSVCYWTLNLTTSSVTDITISLGFSQGTMGVLIIQSYYLPNSISTLASHPMQYYVDNQNYQSFSTISLQQSNYLYLIYYTGNTQTAYSGFQFIWGADSGSSSILSKALTITALCLVSVFCMGCCGVLCRRLYKTARSTSRVYDQAITDYQRRARVYEELPENSVFSEDMLQRCFPKQEFKENMLELGEKVCCICFEE